MSTVILGIEAPPLRPGDVHVWPVRLDHFAGRYDELAAWLDRTERSRADRFVFERDRRAFVLGRALLRRLLGDYLGLPPASVLIGADEHGKPVLAEGRPAKLHFNASGTAGRAIYAFALGRAIGVDLERHRSAEEIVSIVDHTFAPDEQQDFHQLRPAEQPAAFCRTWARKEAYLKATGMGLRRELDAFAVTVLPDTLAALRWDRDDPAAPTRWRLSDVDVWPGYSAALCTDGRLEMTVLAGLS